MIDSCEFAIKILIVAYFWWKHNADVAPIKMICTIRFWCQTDQPHRRHHDIISSGSGRPTAALVHQGSMLTFPVRSIAPLMCTI